MDNNYTFKPTSEGNVEIYKGKEKIGTGSQSYAQSFGYNPTVTQTPQSTGSLGISDAEVDRLASQGYREGDYVPDRGVLTPEGTFRKAVITSDIARKQATTDLNDLNNINVLRNQKTTETKPKETSLIDETLAKMTSGTTPTKSSSVTEAETQINELGTQIENLRRTVDSRTSNIIDNIRSEYESLIRQQEVLNRNYEAGVTTEGLVSGRARYAPTIQAGIIATAVSQGLSKISALQAKKEALIIEAENARDEKNIKLLSEKMQNYREAVKEERKAAQETYENAIRASQEARAAAKEERDRVKETLDSISAVAYNSLTGDEKKDQETITTLAQDYGLDPNQLLSSILDYEREQQKDAPTMIKEYEYAVRAGYFNGTLNEYRQQFGSKTSGTPKSKTLTVKEAINLGLPALAGLEEESLALSLFSETPPDWFRVALEERRQQSLMPEVVQAEWNKFKNEPETESIILERKNVGEYGGESGLTRFGEKSSTDTGLETTGGKTFDMAAI